MDFPQLSGFDAQALLKLRLELECTRWQLQQARHLALHDSLTGLPNRLHFQRRCRRALVRHESGGREFGLIFMDLNRFKAINDERGHAVGDLLLQVIGERLRHMLRAGDWVCRHGGDEFICIVLDVQNDEQIAAIARKLCEAVAAPCQLDRTTLRVTASFGFAVYPRDGTTIEALTHAADLAMLHSKANGESAALRSPLRRAAADRIPA